MSRGHRLKGQFFMIGAISLAVLFFLGLPTAMLSGTGGTEDMTVLAENLERELPMAINTILLEGESPSRLGEFLGFVRDNAGSRYMDLGVLCVAAIPDSGNPGDVTIHGFNWLGESTLLGVDIDGDSQQMALDDAGSGSLGYSGVSQGYDIQASWRGGSWSADLPRDKTSICCFLSLSREGNRIMKEIAS